jgi:hypothetical protein
MGADTMASFTLIRTVNRSKTETSIFGLLKMGCFFQGCRSLKKDSDVLATCSFLVSTVRVEPDRNSFFGLAFKYLSLHSLGWLLAFVTKQISYLPVDSRYVCVLCEVDQRTYWSTNMLSYEVGTLGNYTWCTSTSTIVNLRFYG